MVQGEASLGMLPLPLEIEVHRDSLLKKLKKDHMDPLPKHVRILVLTITAWGGAHASSELQRCLTCTNTKYLRIFFGSTFYEKKIRYLKKSYLLPGDEKKNAVSLYQNLHLQEWLFYLLAGLFWGTSKNTDTPRTNPWF